MSFWLTLLGTLVSIFKESLPLLKDWVVNFNKNKELQQARQRVSDVQEKAYDTVQLMLEGKEDELSRREVAKLRILRELFKLRELKSPKPS